MTNLYRVGFETKKGGFKAWLIDIEANTAKEAQAKAKSMWQKDAHMFGIEVKRLKAGDEFLYHTFVREYVVAWMFNDNLEFYTYRTTSEEDAIKKHKEISSKDNIKFARWG